MENAHPAVPPARAAAAQPTTLPPVLQVRVQLVRVVLRQGSRSEHHPVWLPLLSWRAGGKLPGDDEGQMKIHHAQASPRLRRWLQVQLRQPAEWHMPLM